MKNPINKFLTELHQHKPGKLLIFSVGNPSPKFDGTRHNAGHMALDYFIKHMGGLADTGMYWDSTVEMSPLSNHPLVYMAKSQLYMNLSGKAFKSAVNKIGSDCRIIVLHDDIDTNLGAVKFKLESRQAGAHGGLNSIIQHYSKDFARIRLGIGSPEDRSPGTVAKYVLKKFPLKDRQIFEEQTLPHAFEMFKEIVQAMDKRPKQKRSPSPQDE